VGEYVANYDKGIFVSAYYLAMKSLIYFFSVALTLLFMANTAPYPLASIERPNPHVLNENY